MNAARRKLLAQAEELISQGRDLLEEAAQGEREYYDAMPDSIRDGEKGQRADEVATLLEDAVSAIEDLDLSDAAS